VEFTAARALELSEKAVLAYAGAVTEHDPDEGDHVVPSELRHFLARLRLLHGVPFSYLVPDENLLPVESIRFFYLDRAWTDALVQGALSVGTISTSDRAELEQVHPHVRAEVDATERKVRTPRDEPLLQGTSGTITGFLLRSRVVSGWPGLHVRGYSEDVLPDDELSTVAESHPSRMKVLRMERLAPAVLLVLFDGVPAVVHVEEPRQGLQFGIRIDPESPPSAQRAVVKVRDQRDGRAVPPEDEYEAGNTVPVPFRRGAPGVIDLKRLRERLLAKDEVEASGVMEPHDFALQLLRFPFRQVFGDPANAQERERFYDLDRFVVTTSVTAWTTALRAAVEDVT
jgi:hypothetical protein